jgi:hypothetical protein
MSVRDRGTAAFAAAGAPVKARHFGGSSGLIDEHRALGIECLLEFGPEVPAMRNVSSIANPSFVHSSVTVRHFKFWPFAHQSNTKS